MSEKMLNLLITKKEFDLVREQLDVRIEQLADDERDDEADAIGSIIEELQNQIVSQSKELPILEKKGILQEGMDRLFTALQEEITQAVLDMMDIPENNDELSETLTTIGEIVQRDLERMCSDLITHPQIVKHFKKEDGVSSK